MENTQGDHAETVVTRHIVNGCNEKLSIRAVGEKGPGGAYTRYMISGMVDSDGGTALPLELRFQNGDPAKVGTNGITHEALLAIVEHRLMGFQSGPFASAENAVATDVVRAAMCALQRRTRRRQAQGIEGQQVPDPPAETEEVEGLSCIKPLTEAVAEALVREKQTKSGPSAGAGRAIGKDFSAPREFATPAEAYAYALDVVQQLAGTGLEVEVRPSNDRSDADPIEKYDGKPGRVPAAMWVNVTFRTKTQEQQEVVYQAQDHLNELGIYFDSGGGFGGRDWELDWSFRYNGPGEPDPSHEATKEVADALMNRVNAPAAAVPPQPPAEGGNLQASS